MSIRNTSQKPSYDIAERVSSLETAVKNIAVTLTDIQHSLAKRSETNWSAIFAGLALVLALWAASVRPISNDIARLEATQSSLVQLMQMNQEHDQIGEVALKILEAKLDALIKSDEKADADRRLSLLEMRHQAQQGQ